MLAERWERVLRAHLEKLEDAGGVRQRWKLVGGLELAYEGAEALGEVMMVGKRIERARPVLVYEQCHGVGVVGVMLVLCRAGESSRWMAERLTRAFFGRRVAGPATLAYL